MLRSTYLLALSAFCLIGPQATWAADGLCGPLRKFVESVKAGEERVLKFHTSWGSNFKDSAELALSAKRCDHNGYEPAKNVCAYLMQYGATEFSGNNAKEAVTCLWPQTHFTPRTQIHALSLSLNYGTDYRGSNVDVDYVEDKELGGMVLSITARGY
jgi:hypothetical protein